MRIGVAASARVLHRMRSRTLPARRDAAGGPESLESSCSTSSTSSASSPCSWSSASSPRGSRSCDLLRAPRRRVGCRRCGVPRVRPRQARAVLMDVLLAVLQAATLVLILALVYRPLGDYMAHIYTSTKDWRVERGLYRLVGVDPRSEQSWPALPARRARLLGRRRALRLRPAARAGRAAVLARAPRRARGPVVQHGGVLRDEHELAVVLARAHDGLHGAARRPRRAELRVGRRRHRRGRRPGARIRAPQVGHDRQLLGRPVPRVVPAAAADLASSARSS